MFWKLLRNIIMINIGIFMFLLNILMCRSLFMFMLWRLWVGDIYKSKIKMKLRVSVYILVVLGILLYKILYLIFFMFVCNVIDWDLLKFNYELVWEKFYLEL